MSLKILNETECKSVVKKSLNISEDKFQLLEYNFDVVPKNLHGFCAEYYYLNVVIKEDNSPAYKKLQYFVKTLPQKNEETESEVIESFRREAVLYSKLFEEMDKSRKSQKWHGECYYARDNILVLQNLAILDFRMKYKNEVFSQLHIDVTLKCMARIHANSIALEKLTGVSIGEKYADYLSTKGGDTESCNKFYSVGFRTLKHQIENHPRLQCPKIKSFIRGDFEKNAKEMLDISEAAKKYRKTFCHRDVWHRNILFKYSEKDPSVPVDCILVDFAGCQYNPPALDVLHFLYYYTTTAIRKSSFRSMLEFYYKCLVEEGQFYGIDMPQEISWEEFLESCECVKFIPLLMSAIDMPFDLIDDYLIEIRSSDPEGYKKFVHDDRTEIISEFMEKDENYKEILLNVVEEFVNYMIGDDYKF